MRSIKCHASFLSSFVRMSATVAMLCVAFATSAKDFRIVAGETVGIYLPDEAKPVAYTALEMLKGDIGRVLGAELVETRSKNANIVVSIDPAKVPQKEGFHFEAAKDGRLHITAHDSHGAAFGLLEISRMAGVSPWEWWADAAPRRLERLLIPAGYVTVQSPAVEYRGIFINDEDWGMMPWSSGTYDRLDTPGTIGPRTNARIFELLLRLRANSFWPAMHECTVPFFLTDGNREMAEKYGIYIGTSHCEPMACNVAGEWGRRGSGEYDYIANHDSVYAFWEKRVREVAGQEIIYTLGMRGVHDGAMQGASTIDDRRNTLARVISDQRGLLSKHVSKDLPSVPQVFIPYKEVLDVYDSGLDVPRDVTLMWCDDNYGYITRLPTEAEAARPGGNGIYYHVSYWGRPHDYLWLGTFPPGLLFHQMSLAYEKGARKMWILNVGDIKPAEYQTELFMDMAWDIDAVAAHGVETHLHDFLVREFGETAAQALFPAMKEHYRLASVRRPEFMGNTREEEQFNPDARTVKDLPWSAEEINRRLSDYRLISDMVEEVESMVPADRRDTYFQLVKYPVQGSTQMNIKTLTAQLARHALADGSLSDLAYDSIVTLTDTYNRGYANAGKWQGIMDCSPRRLPVFDKINDKSLSPTLLPESGSEILRIPASSAKGEGREIPLLGGAIAIPKGATVSFSLPPVGTNEIEVELRFLPTHNVGGDNPSAAVSVCSGQADTIDWHTVGRSEEWKQNVLRGYASRRIKLDIDPSRSLSLEVTSLADGVAITEMLVYAPKTQGLAGLTVGVFGDSYVRNHMRPYSETWHARAAQALGMRYLNFGLNGSAIAVDRTEEGFGPPMTKRINSLPDSLDMLLVIAGHNDAGFLQRENGRLAFRDSLEVLCQAIERKYPQTAVAFVLPWNVNRPGFSEVIAGITQACLLHGFALFNPAMEAGIQVNDDGFRNLYFQNGGVNDTAHLNAAGHALIIPSAEEFMITLVRRNGANCQSAGALH